MRRRGGVDLPGDGPVFDLGLLDDDETVLSGNRNRSGRGHGGEEYANGKDLLGKHFEWCLADLC